MLISTEQLEVAHIQPERVIASMRHDVVGVQPFPEPHSVERVVHQLA
jgi:hypothetical protein